MVSLRDKEESLTARVRQALGREYDDLRLYGKGGTATVYTGLNRRLSRKEAVKILAGIGPLDSERLRGFEQECRALAALSHPNIITIFNAGVDEESGLAWLAQEFIDGDTLRGRLRYGPMGADDGLRTACALFEALRHAHGRRIIHRDIKPENIFLESSGRVVLADFGIALLAGSGEKSASLPPDSGRPAGTAAYMSPEQIRCGHLHATSDLYACGLVLYEMLTGRHPFHSPDPQIMVHRQLHDAPRSPRAVQPDLPDELSRLILDLLQKDPKKRPPTADEVLVRLRQILPKEPAESVGHAVEPLSEDGTDEASATPAGSTFAIPATAPGRSRAGTGLGTRSGKSAGQTRWIGQAVILGGAVVALVLWIDSGTVRQEPMSSGNDQNSIQSPIPETSLPKETPSRELGPPDPWTGREPSFLRVILAGDRGAADGSVILLDGIEQPARAPAVVMIPSGGDSCRITLRKFGVRFEPGERVVTRIPPGDTLDVRFLAMEVGASAW